MERQRPRMARVRATRVLATRLRATRVQASLVEAAEPLLCYLRLSQHSAQAQSSMPVDVLFLRRSPSSTRQRRQSLTPPRRPRL
jgi:hypothetical protein